MLKAVEGKPFQPCSEFVNDPQFLLWLGRNVTTMDLMTAALQEINRSLVRSDQSENVGVGFYKTDEGGLEILVANPRRMARHEFVNVRIPKLQAIRLAEDYSYRKRVAQELRRVTSELFVAGRMPKGLQLNGIVVMPGLPAGRGVARSG